MPTGTGGRLQIADPVAVVERDLEVEFAELVSAETLHELATREVARYDGAPVREFVAVLAWRQARRTARHLAPRGGSEGQVTTR